MCSNKGVPSSKTKYDALSDRGEYRKGEFLNGAHIRLILLTYYL